MKNKVRDFVKSLNSTCKYSGKTKTMYFKNYDIEVAVFQKFGWGLPFRLATTVSFKK